jgi:outer membrane protein assembly factor BamB
MCSTFPRNPRGFHLQTTMKHVQNAFALFLASVALNSVALATDILTNRKDNARTGLNSTETILTPANVSSPSFGLRYNNPVDGPVFAQPLYVSNQPIVVSGQSLGTHNVLYVATEHDSLYAFDADSGTQLWQVSLLQTGESPVQHGDHTNCPDSPTGEIGITATPAIDRSAGPNGTIFVLMAGRNGNASNFFHRLHAIDLSTGQDRLTPVIIAASVTGTGPATTFRAYEQRSRSGLLLANHAIYTAWASYCDHPPYAGWIIAYNEVDLSQAGVVNTDPDGVPASNAMPDGSGSGIWQSANGPAADASGNIYVSTGNGPFDTNLNTAGFPTHPDFGDSVLKISPTLAVADYFTPFDQAFDTENDTDLGSAGPMVVDILDSSLTVHHLLVQSGKDTNLYVLNRDNLGKFDPSTNPRNPNIYQFMPGGIPRGAWSSPAYFNGSVYYGGINGPLLRFKFNSQAFLDQASSQTNTFFGYPGATPTISSNGNSNGIVWAYENAGQAVLHAYDATNLGTELYNSSHLSIGGAVTFGVPTVCNGLVFLGTSASIAAFGMQSPDSHMVGAGDFNGDGKADIVWENRATGVRTIWLMNNGTFTGNIIGLGTVDPSWHIAGVGDFGNGQSDLVWENTVTGARAIWLMSNGVFQSSMSLGTISTQWHIAGVGNFGNGQADLVWENTVTGQHAIWLLSSGVLQSVIGMPTIGGGWHVVGAGDFNGRGQADVVWENNVTGGRAIWLMTNGVFNGNVINLGTVSTRWHIAGVGDFLGNGQSDLMWENTTTNTRAIWLLNPNGTINQTLLVH